MGETRLYRRTHLSVGTLSAFPLTRRVRKSMASSDRRDARDGLVGAKKDGGNKRPNVSSDESGGVRHGEQRVPQRKRVPHRAREGPTRLQQRMLRARARGGRAVRDRRPPAGLRRVDAAVARAKTVRAEHGRPADAGLLRRQCVDGRRRGAEARSPYTGPHTTASAW
jgi:hypothetical protein